MVRIEPGQSDDRHRWRKPMASADRRYSHDGITVVRCSKPPPRNVNKSGPGIDRDGRPLVEAVVVIIVCSQDDRRAPRSSAIARAAEKNLTGKENAHLAIVKRGESNVDISHGDGLRHHSVRWRLRDLQGAPPAATHDIDGHPGLVQESACASRRDHAGAKVTDGISVSVNRPCSRASVFFVVEIQESAEKDLPLIGTASKSYTAIPEEAAGAGADDRIRRSIPLLQWRTYSFRRLVQGISG